MARRTLALSVVFALPPAIGCSGPHPLAVAAAPAVAAAAVARCSPGSGGNPILDGWYADPDMKVYGDTYWLYPTYSAPYDEQTFLDAFSSPDLVHWTKHPRVLDTTGVAWAKRAIWAPSPISRDGTYFLFFGANDIQTDQELGGIGVATAQTPAGPFRDALGHPLIGRFAHGAQPIDQDVFLDDDGQAYLYYGGWKHCNVVKLNRDLTSLGTFEEGSTFREITPPGYVEGALMFKRRGTYYLMWSEGGWTGPDYRVSYAMARSPVGPFTRRGTILVQNPAIATGSGHNTVVNVPGTDDWYIFYHRHPLGDRDGNHRVVAYDRMTFAGDGSIDPVAMTTRDEFCDDNALGWQPAAGRWTVERGRYVAAAGPESAAFLNTHYAQLVYDAEVSVGATGDAGVVFRASGTGGYTAVLDVDLGRVMIYKSNGGAVSELASAAAVIGPGTTHHLRVAARGAQITAWLDGAATPTIAVADPDHAAGTTGLISHGAAAAFDRIQITGSATDPP